MLLLVLPSSDHCVGIAILPGNESGVATALLRPIWDKSVWRGEGGAILRLSYFSITPVPNWTSGTFGSNWTKKK